jgi:hypothetical protein
MLFPLGEAHVHKLYLYFHPRKQEILLWGNYRVTLWVLVFSLILRQIHVGQSCKNKKNTLVNEFSEKKNSSRIKIIFMCLTDSFSYAILLLFWGGGVVLTFVLKTLNLLGWCSTIWTMPSSLLCSGYFGDRILLLPRPTWTVVLLV